MRRKAKHGLHAGSNVTPYMTHDNGQRSAGSIAVAPCPLDVSAR